MTENNNKRPKQSIALEIDQFLICQLSCEASNIQLTEQELASHLISLELKKIVDSASFEDENTRH